MRARTRNAVVALVGIVAVLIALGAVPGLLKSGDPYYVTATPQGAWDDANGTLADGNQTAVNATALSPDRFPFVTAALANASADAPGRSDPYWEGYVGIKEAFTHSPFDEREALGQRNATARTGEGVYVHDSETVYLLTVDREDR